MFLVCSASYLADIATMQFAYNEASFMLIRLLQQVSGIHLMQEVNPKAVPPEGYSDGPLCNGHEKVFFRNHLTLYIQVSRGVLCSLLLLTSHTGWSVGQNGSTTAGRGIVAPRKDFYSVYNILNHLRLRLNHIQT